MADDIIDIRKIPSIVGAHAADCAVVVDGRQIPNMRCIDNGETIDIILDRRFCYTFPKEIAYKAAHFAAQAMAIGMGYPFLRGGKQKKAFRAKSHEFRYR